MSDAAALMRFEANKKSMLVAYLLWWFLGMFGAHRLYMGRIGSGVALLLISVFSFLLMVVLIGFVTIFISFIWWLIDAFLIPGMVRDWNNRLVDALASPQAVPV